MRPKPTLIVQEANLDRSDKTSAHSIQTNKGVFAVLLGSGISRAAGIPAGGKLP